jgi:hypothetical protein
MRPNGLNCDVASRSRRYNVVVGSVPSVLCQGYVSHPTGSVRSPVAAGDLMSVETRFDAARARIGSNQGRRIMFGIFKKKQPSAMDSVIRAVYGDNPPAKSADLERAITIAHEDLLAEQVPIAEVRRIASGLAAGPIPYSTYDLSVAAALSFFKNPDLLDRLNEIQMGARLRVLNWMKDGKVAPGVLKIFEDTLYRVYKPSAEADGRDLEFEAADRELDAKFGAFKNQNIGKNLHHAAKVVRDFIVWQHNFGEIEKPYDRTDAQYEHAKRIERAFLTGAAGMAAEGFSLPDSDERLFLLNIVGTYKGFGPGDAEDEIARMFEASEAEEKATRIGGAVMIDHLANGKADKNKVHLAALQKACWD